LESRNIEKLTIRQACPDDIADIIPLSLQLGYPATPEEVFGRLKHLLGDEEHIILVAELPGGKVAGWVQGFVYKPFYSGFMAEVAGLVVDKDCRGQGIGKKLMLAVEAWAKEQDCSIVSLRSNIIRKEAHAFYKNIGYDLIKESYTFRKKL